MNNRCVLFIPRSQKEYLYNEAVRQNDVVFQAPGLKVLAAPWNYAVSAKLDRVGGASPFGSRPYDLPDPVGYLHRYLTINRLGAVRQSDVASCAQSFDHKHFHSSTLQSLDDKYARTYGKRVVQMGA